MSTVNSLWIRCFYKLVGLDQFGNKYYLGKQKNYLNKNKRYVIYNGIEDGSKVPAEWHAWLHYLTDKLPEHDDHRYNWQINHVQNLTGSKSAYNPSENLMKEHEVYSKWTPEG